MSGVEMSYSIGNVFLIFWQVGHSREEFDGDFFWLIEYKVNFYCRAYKVIKLEIWIVYEMKFNKNYNWCKSKRSLVRASQQLLFKNYPKIWYLLAHFRKTKLKTPSTSTTMKKQATSIAKTWEAFWVTLVSLKWTERKFKMKLPTLIKIRTSSPFLKS